eukprot:c11571_g1_i1 orf=1-294(-)
MPPTALRKKKCLRSNGQALKLVNFESLLSFSQILAMAGELPPQLNLDAKWDACHEIALHRCFYSSLVGAASALLFLRSPVKRWATVAFAAGVGLGSAY